MNKRTVIYPIAFLFSAILFMLPGFLSSPQRNIRAIAQAASVNTSTSHQTFSSFLKPHKDGYILVIYTGNNPEFAPIEYATIDKRGKNIIIDLISGPGEENISQITGKEALAFLEKHNLKLDDLDALSSKN